MGQSDHTPRYLKEYLNRFVWYHVDEMRTREMAAWLVNYGRQYRDWTVIEGHMYENACFVYIKDRRVGMLFEIAFGPYILNKHLDNPSDF